MKWLAAAIAALFICGNACADPMLSFNDFRNLIASRIHAQAPAETTRVEGPSMLVVTGGPRGEMQLDLSGTYRGYQNDPSRLDYLVSREVGLATSAATHDAAHLTILVETRARFALFGAADIQTRPLGGDVIEVLALRSPFDADLVNDHELSELNMHADAAWTRAAVNSGDTPRLPERELQNGVSVIGAEDSTASTVLAGDHFCETSPWAGDVLVVFSEDYFLALSNADPAALAVIAHLRSSAPNMSQIYLKCQDGRLAPWTLS